MAKYLKCIVQTLVFCLAVGPAFASADSTVPADPSGATAPSAPAASSDSGDTSQFQTAAQKCGVEAQNECQPDPKKTGNVCGHYDRSDCGWAARIFVQCMARERHIDGCMTDGVGCGDGKMWKDCDNGSIQKCGYKKVPALSSLCDQPGAIRSYTETQTKAGKEAGHVEFDCGTPLMPQFCSMYPAVSNHPWPRAMPDGCWYPTQADGTLPKAHVMSASDLARLSGQSGSGPAASATPQSAGAAAAALPAQQPANSSAGAVSGADSGTSTYAPNGGAYGSRGFDPSMLNQLQDSMFDQDQYPQDVPPSGPGGPVIWMGAPQAPPAAAPTMQAVPKGATPTIPTQSDGL